MKKNIFISISLLIFLLFLILYKLDYLNNIDNSVYNLIIKIKSNSMTEVMKFLTFFGSTSFIVFVICLLFLMSIRFKKIPIIINGVVILEVFINNLVKILVKRDRPKIINLVNETSFSFPSGHTMVSVVLYGFIIYLINKSKINKTFKITLNIVLSLLILFIMVSRIYLGAHYFSDVIAGFGLALGYLLIIIKIIERKKMI